MTKIMNRMMTMNRRERYLTAIVTDLMTESSQLKKWSSLTESSQRQRMGLLPYKYSYSQHTEREENK
jgi:hypothetical protein